VDALKNIAESSNSKEVLTSGRRDLPCVPARPLNAHGPGGLHAENPKTSPKGQQIMNELRDDQLLTIVKNVVEQHGCHLVDIDFDTHILNIEGPEEAQAQCAVALEQVFGG
jgi:hypothetical protein